MSERLRYIRRRLAQSAVVVLLVIVINFFVLHLAPGDIADVLGGEAQAGDAAYMEKLRASLGLDQPLVMQLAHYIWRLVRFDLGISPGFGEPVASLIAARLPATLLLMVSAIAIAFVLGTVLGILAARRVGKPLDAVISLVAMLFYATPTFLIGLALIVIFTVKLQWLPIAGMVTPGADFGVWEAMLDVARHLVMPALSLGLFYVAIYTRLMRASMLEVLSLDYIRTARAKGLTETRVLVRHGMRNAMLPMVTMLGLQMGSMLGGAVLVETVFGWPGIGRLAFEAVFRRDVALVLGILFISSLAVALVNLLVDFLYVRLDPRIALA